MTSTSISNLEISSLGDYFLNVLSEQKSSLLKSYNLRKLKSLKTKIKKYYLNSDFYAQLNEDDDIVYAIVPLKKFKTKKFKDIAAFLVSADYWGFKSLPKKIIKKINQIPYDFLYKLPEQMVWTLIESSISQDLKLKFITHNLKNYSILKLDNSDKYSVFLHYWLYMCNYLIKKSEMDDTSQFLSKIDNDLTKNLNLSVDYIDRYDFFIQDVNMNQKIIFYPEDNCGVILPIKFESINMIMFNILFYTLMEKSHSDYTESVYYSLFTRDQLEIDIKTLIQKINFNNEILSFLLEFPKNLKEFNCKISLIEFLNEKLDTFKQLLATVDFNNYTAIVYEQNMILNKDVYMGLIKTIFLGEDTFLSENNIIYIVGSNN